MTPLTADRRRAILHIAIACAAAAATLAPATGLACGACLEDKIAATYDHGVVTHAAAVGDVVVFCAISGPFDAPRVSSAVRRVHGVRRESLRVSADLAAISFAVDPKVSSARAAVSAAQRAMPSGSRLTLLRLMRTEAPVPL